ncbi:MAG: urea amidolyase, partial [Pseudarthrobacter sp.]|nr:urea amidolyase [Pseudarthrobacter sp.]
MQTLPEHALAETVADGASRHVRSVRFVGRLAVLAELERPEDVLALTRFLAETPLPGQQEVIPAAETVLVTASSPAAAVEIAGRLEGLELPSLARSGSKRVVIDTVYDGPDLAAVAELAGISADAVVAA